MRISEILNEGSDFDFLAELNPTFKNMRRTAMIIDRLKKNSKSVSTNFKNPNLVRDIIKQNNNIQNIENNFFDVVDEMINDIESSDIESSTKHQYVEMFSELKKFISGAIEETLGNASAIPGRTYSSQKKSPARSKIESLLK